MQRLLRFFTDFGPTRAWILLGFVKDFVSADKIGVCKSGFNRISDITNQSCLSFELLAKWYKARNGKLINFSFQFFQRQVIAERHVTATDQYEPTTADKLFDWTTKIT